VSNNFLSLQLDVKKSYIKEDYSNHHGKYTRSIAQTDNLPLLLFLNVSSVGFFNDLPNCLNCLELKLNGL